MKDKRIKNCLMRLISGKMNFSSANKKENMKLQEIRAYQALEELGKKELVRIDHKKPETKIGETIYTLVFPKFMLDYNEPKVIEKLFVGKITPQRRVFLNNFPEGKIIHSKRGRNPKTKNRDERYFKLMSSAKLVLCPNGDYVWTYRFFEAIIFRAIPIIEEECDIYDGYKFYKLGENFKYNTNWVNHNLNKLKKEMTLERFYQKDTLLLKVLVANIL